MRAQKDSRLNMMSHTYTYYDNNRLKKKFTSITVNLRSNNEKSVDNEFQLIHTFLYYQFFFIALIHSTFNSKCNERITPFYNLLYSTQSVFFIYRLFPVLCVWCFCDFFFLVLLLLLFASFVYFIFLFSVCERVRKRIFLYDCYSVFFSVQYYDFL